MIYWVSSYSNLCPFFFFCLFVVHHSWRWCLWMARSLTCHFFGDNVWSFQLPRKLLYQTFCLLSSRVTLTVNQSFSKMNFQSNFNFQSTWVNRSEVSSNEWILDLCLLYIFPWAARSVFFLPPILFILVAFISFSSGSRFCIEWNWKR